MPKTLWIVFQSGCTILHSHQQWIRVAVAPPPCHHLACQCSDWGHSSKYTGVAHCLICPPWWHTMWGIFSSAYLPSVYLLWWDVCSGLWHILKLGLFVFMLLNFKSSLYILDNNTLSDVSFANIFSLSWLVFSFSCYYLTQNKKI